MARKLGLISYTLATVASICFVSGILVISGGDSNDDRKIRHVYIHDRNHA